MTEVQEDLPLIISHSATKLRRWGMWTLIAMAVFVVMVLLIPDFAAEMEGEGGMFVFAVLFFTACGGVMLWRSIRGGPLLTADEMGVTLHNQSGDFGPVRWDEIAAIQVKSFRGVRHIAFELYEPDRTIERLGTTQSWGAKAASFFGVTPMMLSTVSFDEPPYRLRDRLDALRLRAGGSQNPTP